MITSSSDIMRCCRWAIAIAGDGSSQIRVWASLARASPALLRCAAGGRRGSYGVGVSAVRSMARPAFQIEFLLLYWLEVRMPSRMSEPSVIVDGWTALQKVRFICPVLLRPLQFDHCSGR